MLRVFRVIQDALPQLFQLFFADQPGFVAVVTADVRHFCENVFLVPERPQVDDPSALVPDVLQLVVLGFRPLPLRPALPGRPCCRCRP